MGHVLNYVPCPEIRVSLPALELQSPPHHHHQNSRGHRSQPRAVEVPRRLLAHFFLFRASWIQLPGRTLGDLRAVAPRCLELEGRDCNWANLYWLCTSVFLKLNNSSF